VSQSHLRKELDVPTAVIFLALFASTRHNLSITGSGVARALEGGFRLFVGLPAALLLLPLLAVMALLAADINPVPPVGGYVPTEAK
jgi:hypothetical protein